MYLSFGNTAEFASVVLPAAEIEILIGCALEIDCIVSASE